MLHFGNTPRRFTPAILIIGLVSAQARGASINYGTFGPFPGGIGFVNVTESSVTDPVPLLGPPQAYAIAMDFDPTNFVSYSNAAATDSTNGRLEFTLTSSTGGIRVEGISIFEAGDYTKVGTGTPLSSILAAATLRATVTGINGSPVTPIVLTPVNASFGTALPGAAVVQPWSLGLFLNVEAQLVGLGFTPNDFPTAIDVQIDNNLSTVSQASSALSIAKKEFQVNVQVTDFIPEPGTLLLAAAMCGALILRRR